MSDTPNDRPDDPAENGQGADAAENDAKRQAGAPPAGATGTMPDQSSPSATPPKPAPQPQSASPPASAQPARRTKPAPVARSEGAEAGAAAGSDRPRRQGDAAGRGRNSTQGPPAAQAGAERGKAGARSAEGAPPARQRTAKAVEASGTARAVRAAEAAPLPADRAPALKQAQVPARLPPAESGAQQIAAALPPGGPSQAVTAAHPAAPAEAPAKAPRRRRARFGESRRMTSSKAALLSMTSQEDPMAEQTAEPDFLRTLYAALLRVVALVWILATVVIWARLLGYLDAGLPLSWYGTGEVMVPTVVSAILAPIVAVGLWLVASWGIVVWVASILAGLFTGLTAPGTVPFGVFAMVTNILMMLVVATVFGVRAWRDRETED